MAMKTRTPAERVWSRVTRGDAADCWLWPGSTNGRYGITGRGGRQRGNVYVHRVAYESEVGPIPPGMVIDHLCRQILCCNPAHLEPVTQSENLRRATTSMSTLNAAKTHCPSQHPYDEANTYVSPAGTRFCRTCDREKKRALREARRAV